MAAVPPVLAAGVGALHDVGPGDLCCFTTVAGIHLLDRYSGNGSIMTWSLGYRGGSAFIPGL